MESAFTDLLMESEITKSFSIVIGGILVVFGIYKVFKEIKKAYDSKVKEIENQKNEEKKFKDSVTSSLNRIGTIDSSINNLSLNINSLSEEFSSFKENTIHSLDDLGEKQKLNMEELNTLIESDKESIKAYIISEYQKWTRLKYIDIYAMQCLESRYEKYLKENGNTFISTLMSRLRSLPSKYVINTDDNDTDNP